MNIKGDNDEKLGVPLFSGNPLDCHSNRLGQRQGESEVQPFR